MDSLIKAKPSPVGTAMMTKTVKIHFRRMGAAGVPKGLTLRAETKNEVRQQSDPNEIPRRRWVRTKSRKIPSW